MQQEKQIDTNQLIGFGLIAILLAIFFYFNQPSELEKKAAEKSNNSTTAIVVNQSLAQTPLKTTSTAFVLPTTNQEITLENTKLNLKFSSKGGQISQVLLKDYKAYDHSSKNHQKELYLIKNNNARFDLVFKDLQGKEIHTADLAFTPTLLGNKLSMKAETVGGFIEYNYTLNNDYKVDFDIKTQGFNTFSTVKNPQLNWSMDVLSEEKGRGQETQYSELYYSLNNLTNTDYKGEGDVTEDKDKIDWLAFKQQFFATILTTKKGFNNSKASIKKAVETDSLYIKKYTFSSPLALTNNELSESLILHFTPLEYDLLKSYGANYEKVIPFGWTLFGWLNKYFFIKVFHILANFGIGYGWVILLMTVVVKLVTSPIMYKQNKQSAIMRALKPEIEELNEKHKGDDALKKQQATMALYSKVGVNPMAGCLPALLQIPIFYALFNLFPNLIDLRGKSFLWAEDLTAYDSVLQLPFNIPFYGSHISLFALLYIVVLLIYTRMTASNMQQPTQEGMPDMKMLMYIMPVMFIFVLNSYASGLSWYYFVSNLINIGMILVIREYFIDEDKIHAQLQENKAKPKKKKAWQEKLSTMMEQAQEQQKQADNKKKGK